VKQEDLVIENGMDKDIDDILELLEKLSGDKRSIFEVPIIMKASVPAEMYYEKKVKTMMSGMLDIIKEYIHRFCSEKEYYAEYAALLSSQYGLFLKNISREKEDFPVRDIFHDSLFIYVSGAIQGELEELGLRNKAKLIENVTNKLSRIVM
jgi:putative transposon-encoded protein